MPKVGHMTTSKFLGQGRTFLSTLGHSTLGTLTFLSLFFEQANHTPLSKSLHLSSPLMCSSLNYLHGSHPHILKVFAQLHLINEDFQDSTFFWFFFSPSLNPQFGMFTTTWYTYIIYLCICLASVPLLKCEFLGDRVFGLFITVTPALKTVPGI